MANFLNGGNKTFVFAEVAPTRRVNLQFSVSEIKQRSFDCKHKSKECDSKVMLNG